MSDPIKEAVKSLAPRVYGDLAQPAMREFGSVVGDAVRAVLSPARIGLLTINQTMELAEHRIREKFEQWKVPPEAVRTPPAEIAASVFQMLRFANQDTSVRELYLN